jgi:hypothetical protein
VIPKSATPGVSFRIARLSSAKLHPERKLADNAVRNGKRLAELHSMHRLLSLLTEGPVRIVVKSFIDLYKR